MPTISETCTAADAEMTQMAVFFFRPNLSPQDVSVYYYMKNGNASVQLRSREVLHFSDSLALKLVN